MNIWNLALKVFLKVYNVILKGYQFIGDAVWKFTMKYRKQAWVVLACLYVWIAYRFISG